MEASHLVFVASNFKSLSLALVANDCHIREFDLFVESVGVETYFPNGLDNSTHQNKQIMKKAPKRLFGVN